MHTPRSAARAAGVTKATIYRAIRRGQLAACKLRGGNYAIYPAELRRAFPSAAQASAGVAERKRRHVPVSGLGRGKASRSKMQVRVSPPSLPGLTRQSIFFAKCSCEGDGPPNSSSEFSHAQVG